MHSSKSRWRRVRSRKCSAIRERKNEQSRRWQWKYLPEHAWGGNGKIRVVEDFLLATAQPKLCGLKLRNCCMKSEHSISATSAKCRSQSIWFLNLECRTTLRIICWKQVVFYAAVFYPRIIKRHLSMESRLQPQNEHQLLAMNNSDIVFFFALIANIWIHIFAKYMNINIWIQ